MSAISLRERFRGALLGLACGDAVGTTVEFKRRGTFDLVTDMVGGGPFRLNPGEWTDDTSMALCLATSLIEKQGFHAHDQMSRYVRWMREGYLGCNDTCVDIGMTVMTALRHFRQTGDPFSGPTEPKAAGNGCIMRLAPVPMFYFEDRQKAIAMSAESSRTTHGALECIEASRLFGAMLHSALSGASKDQILHRHGVEGFKSQSIKAIAEGSYRDKDVAVIRSSGYVVESLEAALWCFHRTNSYSEAVLLAANLGYDADTVAAICGQLAGAYYGESAIPQSWRDKLAKAQLIQSLADKLYDADSIDKQKVAIIRQNLDGWFYGEQIKVAIVGTWWEEGFELALVPQTGIDLDCPLSPYECFYFEQGHTDHLLGKTHNLESLDEIAIYPMMMSGKWKASWMEEQGLATDTGRFLEEGWSWPIMKLAPDFFADCKKLLGIANRDS
jgi:ADP-ribosyl-[dinitrogen reductase] hydrolase